MYRIPYENEQITKTIAAPYAPVDFTEEEKEQFRENIGAGSGSGGGRNLLDNWWFGKSVINQRGQSSYTGRGYTIDRWGFGDPTGVLQVNNDYITLTSTGTGSGVTDFEQLLDLSEHIGKTLTVSVMMSDGTIHSGTAVFSTVNTGITVPIADGFTLNLGYYPSKSLNRVYIRNSGNRSGNSISIKAIKLEVSSVSTLANDSPPNHADELRRCQYYFVALSGKTGVLFSASALTATVLDAFIPYEMRNVDPTISWANLSTYEGLTITNVQGFKRGFGEQIRFTVSGATIGRMYHIIAPSVGVPKLWVSADL